MLAPAHPVWVGPIFIHDGLAKMQKYAAFLRGINLGRRNIKMDNLRMVLLEAGFNDPQTVLASGNIVFSSDLPPVPQNIEQILLKEFGFAIGVVVRSVPDLQNLVANDPFGKCPEDKSQKFYLTLSEQNILDVLSGVENVPGDFEIIRRNEREFFTIAHRQPNGRFGAGMDKLERLFKNQVITTRNWNTIGRILKKAATPT